MATAARAGLALALCHAASATAVGEEQGLVEPLGRGTTLLGALLVVSTALLGYIINDRCKHREDQRRLAFERCNQQLEQFFGPLEARLNFVCAAHSVMVRTYAKLAWKDHPQKDVSETALLQSLEDDLAACEQAGTGQLPLAKLYMTFVRDIAMPSTRDILDVLTTKAHLFDGPYPQAFHDYVARAAEWELLVQRWKEGDFAQLTARNTRFPDEIRGIVADRAHEVRERARQLLPEALRGPEPRELAAKVAGSSPQSGPPRYTLLPGSPSAPVSGPPPAVGSGPHQRRTLTLTA